MHISVPTDCEPAAKGAPNIIIVLIDDTGPTLPNTYGDEVPDQS